MCIRDSHPRTPCSTIRYVSTRHVPSQRSRQLAQGPISQVELHRRAPYVPRQKAVGSPYGTPRAPTPPHPPPSSSPAAAVAVCPISVPDTAYHEPGPYGGSYHAQHPVALIPPLAVLTPPHVQLVGRVRCFSL
eukprot:3603110-Rhodomonas_salina.1